LICAESGRRVIQGKLADTREASTRNEREDESNPTKKAPNVWEPDNSLQMGAPKKTSQLNEESGCCKNGFGEEFSHKRKDLKTGKFTLTRRIAGEKRR